MIATGAYVDALENRIADLEVENKKLQNTIADMTRTIEGLLDKERLTELAK